MDQEFITVSELNKKVKSLLESDFSLFNLCVLGEVSTLNKHYTGHYYFTIKDDKAQIDCMMFANYVKNLTFDLKNGDQILVYGRISLYEKTGRYSLNVYKIVPYGEGAYLAYLNALKAKLVSEGVIPRKKLELPLFPKKIALITSKTGAAIHDFLVTLNKRYRPEVYIIPCLVQGDDAPPSIIASIDIALDLNVEMIVITRGGGSKEDLKCFNDEALVRKVSSLTIPVVGAIGHQIDTTLIDYAFDKSFITPTDCGANIGLSKDELLTWINHDDELLKRLMQNQIDNYNEKILNLSRIIALNNPINLLKQQKERSKILFHQISDYVANLVINYQRELSRVKSIAELNIHTNFDNYQKRLEYLDKKLNYLSPNSLLNKGYSFITNKHKVVTSVKEVKVGESISLKVKDGSIEAEIKKVEEQV